MLKKSVACLLVFVCLFGLIPFEKIRERQVAKAETTVYSDELAALSVGYETLFSGSWRYAVRDGYAVILGYDDASVTKLSIPAALDGYYVTGIAGRAFSTNTHLTSITIHGNVTSIMSDAFDGISPTVCAFNGSYALAFAKKRELNTRNLSSYEFTEAVIDLSEVTGSHITPLDDTTLRMHALEARRISEGSLLYLPKRSGIDDPTGKAFEVLSITKQGSYYLLECSIPNLQSVLTRVVIEETELTPDYTNAVPLSDMVTLEQLNSRASFSGSVNAGLTVNINGNYQGITFKGNGRVHYKANIELDAQLFLPKFNRFKTSIVQTYSASITATTGKNSNEAVTKRIKVPLASVPLVGGPVTATIHVNLVGSLSGGFELSAETQNTYTYEYKNKRWNNNATKDKAEISFSLSATASSGLSVDVSFRINMLGANIEVGKVDLSLTIQLTASIDLLQPNISKVRCIDVTPQLILSLNAQVGLIKINKSSIGLKYETSANFSYCPFPKWHLENGAFKDKCSKKDKEIRFVTYSNETPSFTRYANVGDTLEQPASPIRSGYVFNGWYKSPQYQDMWLFWSDTVQEDTVLYANWLKKGQSVAIIPTPTPAPGSSSGTATPTPVPAVTPAPGDTTPLPATQSLHYLLYTLHDDYVEITGYQNDPVAITIPSMIEGLPVTEIAYRAFSDCATLVNVVLPATLDEGGVFSCFDGCPNLHTLSYEKGTQLIPDAAANCESLKKVIIPEGATVIATQAFQNCSSLESVELPASLTEIGKLAFEGCAQLQSIELPLSVTTIGESAFQDCESLENPGWTDAVQTIGAWAYNGCDRLKINKLPAELKQIGASVFTSPYITSITVGNKIVGDSSYSSTADSWTFRECPNLHTIIFEEGLEAITGIAAECASLKKVVIPDGVKTIYFNAFSNCTALSEIELPESLTEIGSEAFQGCISLVDPGWTDNITMIDAWAYWNCPNLEFDHLPAKLEELHGAAFSTQKLTSVTVPKGVSFSSSSYGFDAEAASPFSGCSNLTTIAFEEGTVHVCGQIAQNTPSLKQIILPEGVTHIYGSAFSGCTALETVHLPSTITSIEGSAFKNCTALRDPGWTDSITRIGSEAYLGCTNLQFERLPSNLQMMGDSFVSLDWLTSVTIPKTVFVNGGMRNAFDECPNLETMIFEDGLESIPHYAAYNYTYLKNVVIPDSVANIYFDVFKGCSSLTEITIPSSVNYIASDTFDGSGIATVYCYKGSYADTYFAEKEGVTRIYLDSDKNCLSFDNPYGMVEPQWLSAGELAAEPVWPVWDGYTFHGWYQDLNFEQIWNFATDVMPDRNITLYAKWTEDPKGYVYSESADGLTITGYVGEQTQLVVPDMLNGKPVIAIGSRAFDNSLYSIKLSAGIQNIAEDAFAEAFSLSYFDVAADSAYFMVREGVLFTANGKTLCAYPAASHATSYTVPDGVETIAAHAFRNAQNLRTVTLSDGLTHIGSSAFNGCTSLSSITLPNGLLSIGAYAFSMCESLEAVRIPDSVQIIDSAAFGGNTNLILYGAVGDSVASAFADSYHIRYNLYDVHFYDGDELILSLAMKAGEPLAISQLLDSNEFTMSGWSTVPVDEAQSLSERILWNMETDMMPARELTLYAVWVQEFSFDVVEDGVKLTAYHGNDGRIRVPEIIAGEPVVAIVDDIFKNITVEVLIGNAGSVTESYARQKGFTFEPLTYTLTFLNEDRTVLAEEKLPKGASIQAPQLMLRSGWTFEGWFLSETDAEAVELEKIVMPANDLTLYPRWSESDETGDACVSYRLMDDGTLAVSGAASGVTEIVIPEEVDGHTVTRIDDRAFFGNSTLLEVTLPETLTQIGEYAFAYTRLNSIRIPDAVISLGEGAFMNCGELCSALFGEGIKEIPDYLFANATSLSYVKLPTEVSALGVQSLSGCTLLEEIVLPDTLQSIGEYCFEGCQQLAGIRLGSAVNSVAGNAFQNCVALSQFEVASTNMDYAAVEGVLFNRDLDCLLLYPQGKADVEYAIPEGVVSIDRQAMCNACFQVLTLPSTLASIGQGAVQDCKYLQTIIWPETCSMTEISEKAFFGCIQLKTLEIPNYITTILAQAFAGCSSLESATIGENVVSIMEQAIEGKDWLMITGKTGTSAEAYAWANNIRFNDPDSMIPVGGIVLASTELTVCVGQLVKVEHMLTPSDTTETTVLWSSSDASVAQVSSDGLITALRYGSTVITATAQNGDTAQLALTVIRPQIPLEALRFTSKQLEGYAGLAFKLTVQAVPSNTTDKLSIIWSSSNELVATVDPKGTVHMLAPGETTLTATSAANSDVSVSVFLKVKAFEIFPEHWLLSTDPSSFSNSVKFSIHSPIDAEFEWHVENGTILTLAVSEDKKTAVAKGVFPGKTSIHVLKDGSSVATVPVEVYSSTGTLAIPSMISNINASAFSGNESFSELILDSRQPVSIDEFAFENCYGLKSAWLTGSIERIDPDAFAGCNDFVIYCDLNSAAMSYAVQNRIPYVCE